MPDTLTVADFVRDRNVFMLKEQIDERPDQAKDDNWGRASQWQADHWKCTLRRQMPDGSRRSLVVYYSKGLGHNGAAPTTEEVLDSLALDASVRDQSFEDWCGDYGCDVDSRKAERTYNACVKSAGKLRKFLGPDDFTVLTE